MLKHLANKKFNKMVANYSETLRGLTEKDQANREYGMRIGQKHGKYIVSEIIPGKHKSVNPFKARFLDSNGKVIKGVTTIAALHSHPNNGYIKNVFSNTGGKKVTSFLSPADLDSSALMGVIGVVITPNGTNQLFVPNITQSYSYEGTYPKTMESRNNNGRKIAEYGMLYAY